MTALLDVILPVFLVVGFGYVAVWRGLFSDQGTDALMKFTQGFAIPCLLFSAIANLDLAQNFRADLLLSFYVGAFSGFTAGLLGARFLFGRTWEDSIAIGFVGLFSNSVLLGLPLTERAYGADALSANFAIVSLHAPFCYTIGITAMEIVRNRDAGLAALPGKVFRAIFRNALLIGIGLGFVVNLSGITLPSALTDAIDMMIRAALPAALFGLGGVLYRYRPEGDIRVILFIVGVSLILHPTVTFTLAKLTGLDRDGLRSAVLTSAMAPGVNAYLFANMYGCARRVAASSVLIATALSLFTAWGWLSLLP